MMPADAYRCYLALKNHFTKDHYDYHKYRGKTRATNQAFYKRKDRFWFEKFARQKNDKEIATQNTSASQFEDKPEITA